MEGDDYDNYYDDDPTCANSQSVEGIASLCTRLSESPPETNSSSSSEALLMPYLLKSFEIF